MVSTPGSLPLTFTSPLGEAFWLVSFHGREAISELFRFDLELIAARGTVASFNQVLGQPATVTIQGPGGVVRHVNGLVARFSQLDEDEDYAHFRAELVPRFWLWTRRVQSRVFQQQSTPEILQSVFGGLEVAYSLSRTYPARNYCVQYRESDFAFASRLMEEEGIFYYFQHTQDGHQLIVTDQAQVHPEVPAPTSIPYDLTRGGVNAPRIFEWSKTQSYGVEKCTVWDFHLQLPDHPPQGSANPVNQVEVGKVSHALATDGLEVFEYPTGFAAWFDGVDANGQDVPPRLAPIHDMAPWMARLRVERETAASFDIQGRGTAVNFLPGLQFSLSRHGDAEGKYLLTCIEHEATQSGFRSGQNLEFKYEHRFRCHPAGLAYRPQRRTAKPAIHGTQTATVVGLSVNEPFLDRYGRVKVHFHWDRTAPSASSSCWVPVAQFWAGNGWGAFFWPRPGNEVVVVFQEGDPDRPLIVGSVYDESNLPPFSPTQQGCLSGVKTFSGGSQSSTYANFNGILLNDVPGKEYVHVISENDSMQVSENSHYSCVAQNRYHQTGGVPMAVIATGNPPPGGSGSGGGSGDSQNGNSKVAGTSFTPQFGVDVSFTCGADMTLGVGEIGFFALGAMMSVTYGMGGALDRFVQHMPAAVAAAMLGGDTELNFASKTEIQYGPKIEVTRGNEIHVGGNLEGAAVKMNVFAEAAAAAAFAMTIFGGRHALNQDIQDGLGQKATDPLEAAGVWAPEGIATITAGFVVATEMIEASKGMVETLKTELEVLKQHMDSVASFQIVAGAFEAIMSAGTAYSDTILEVMEGAVTGAKLIETPTTENDLSDKPSIIGAQSTTIIALADAEYPGASYIHLNAKGVKSKDNGDLFVTASRSIDMRLEEAAGGAIAMKAGKGRFYIDAALPQEIKLGLFEGPALLVGLAVDEQKLELECGQEPAKTTIALTPTSIELRGPIGGPVQSVIKLEQDKITISASEIVLESGKAKLNLKAHGNDHGAKLEGGDNARLTLTRSTATLYSQKTTVTAKDHLRLMSAATAESLVHGELKQHVGMLTMV